MQGILGLGPLWWMVVRSLFFGRSFRDVAASQSTWRRWDFMFYPLWILNLIHGTIWSTGGSRFRLSISFGTMTLIIYTLEPLAQCSLELGTIFPTWHEADSARSSAASWLHGRRRCVAWLLRGVSSGQSKTLNRAGCGSSLWLRSCLCTRGSWWLTLTSVAMARTTKSLLDCWLTALIFKHFTEFVLTPNMQKFWKDGFKWKREQGWLGWIALP